MTRITAEALAAVVATANLAPSVHNTQPTRWRLDEDGALWLLADTTRQLKIGDAAGRDLRVSVGTALAGTKMALRAHGLGIGRLDLLPATGDSLAPVVRLELTGADVAEAPAAVPTRMTWRRGFAAAPTTQSQAMQSWVESVPDLTMLTGRAQLETVSALNEKTSLGFYRDAPYRKELLGWMRLSSDDPRFGVDGLSWSALGISRREAFGARFALRQPLFGLLDGLGMVGGLITEHKRTMSASAVLLFHRPAEEDPIETGGVLYRHLLQLANLGLQAWPMSVLADNPETRAELSAAHGIPSERRLITAWRVGLAPVSAVVKRERLSVAQLIV